MSALRSWKAMGRYAVESPNGGDASVGGKVSAEGSGATRVRLSLSRYEPNRDRVLDPGAAHRAVSVGASVHPVKQSLISLALFTAALITIGLIHQSATSVHAPVVLFLLPVMAVGMLFGRFFGIAVLAASLVGERIMFATIDGNFGFGSVDDLLSFASTAVAMIGGSVVAIYAHRAARAVEITQAQCHHFNRDVLLAVTSGRLVLCDSDEIEAMASGEPLHKADVLASADLQTLRCELRAAMQDYLADDKVSDLLTCVTEAATNALKYAGGAAVAASIDPRVISVIISDHGTGIDPSLLARATLENGFSTKNTLGMGYTLMLGMADKIALHTTAHGTQVLIQMQRA